MSNLQLYDIVYIHDRGGNIYPLTIIGISGGTKEPIIYDCGEHNISFDLTAIGKSIFLTKEEAKKHYESEAIENEN